MSSIPKSKRSKSKLDFFYNAYKLSDAITTLLIRDFGMKSISRDLSTFTHNAKMNNEDRDIFNKLCTKYNIDVESSYPSWLIDYYRDWILSLLRDMINNITNANSIYPHFVFEYEMRRKYQSNAISNCYQLLQAFQAAIRVLPVNVEKYMSYVGMIENEIKELKNWRKSDNKRFRTIYEGQLQTYTNNEPVYRQMISIVK